MQNRALRVPPADQQPAGSLVLMSLDGTQKSDLVNATVFWAVVVFGLGFFIGKKWG
jgi:hypothetical protein